MYEGIAEEPTVAELKGEIQVLQMQVTALWQLLYELNGGDIRVMSAKSTATDRARQIREWALGRASKKGEHGAG